MLLCLHIKRVIRTVGMIQRKLIALGTLGECWRQNCCEWADRQEDDICGLDQTKLSLNEKMKYIYLGTSLHREFENIGLEVLS